MKNLLTLLLIICLFSSTAQSFTIQNNYMTASGSSTDNEFAENTYLDALNNGTIFLVNCLGFYSSRVGVL